MPSGQLDEIVARLASARGRDFEQAVSDSFGFLWFDSHMPTEEASSDVIVEALLAANPYFIVIECNAVDDTNEVGYEKLGQLRGNFPSYMDSRRRTLFKRGYKLIVGRPRFSRNTIDRSANDVSLLSAAVLTELIRAHSKYHFSEDEVEVLLQTAGEIMSDQIKAVINSKLREISVCALVLVSLFDDYTLGREKRKNFVPMMQAAGEAQAYARILGIENVSTGEVLDAIKSMSGPFFRLVTTRSDEVRLASIPFSSAPEFESGSGAELKGLFTLYSNRLDTLRRSAQATSGG